MFTSRILRRRWVLAVIFVCSLLYFLASLFPQSHHGLVADEYVVKQTILRQPFQWKPKLLDIANGTKIYSCRNSIQGRSLIADERGYVCNRADLLTGGCCDPKNPRTKRYSCRTCRDNNCCIVYEFCVSCCLRPEKQPILRKILNQPGETYSKLFASLKDHFELCLVKCRTSSQVEDELAGQFAVRVEKELSISDRKEMILLLLGNHFVEKYLPHHKPQLQLLDSLPVNAGSKNKLQDARSWLQSQLNQVVRDTGYQALLSGVQPGKTDNVTAQQFLQHTSQIVQAGLDRALYRDGRWRQEKALKKLDVWKQLPSGKHQEIVSGNDALSLLTTESGTSSRPPQLQQPHLWGEQSDAIGQAVCALLRKDFRKFKTVITYLHGHQLPGSLQSFIWKEMLFSAERKKMKDVNVEKLLRERFAKIVYQGVRTLRIQRATQSPICRLIENVVIETYNKTKSMFGYSTDAHMKEAARVLNVLYVYDRTYEPYLIHWLFPLQLAFEENSESTLEKGEHVYVLSMFLDLLNSACFPTWPQVVAIAERVMAALNKHDPELFDHLKRVAFIDAKVNPKEFLVHLIEEEKAKAETLLDPSPRTIQSLTAVQLLADPVMFLRKWIGEGFVGILDTAAVLFVWDQCFMQCWQQSVLQHVCLAVIELLRPRFLSAQNYGELTEVFFNEPFKLLTADIQMAWIHLENGKSLMDVPYLNRQTFLLSSNSFYARNIMETFANGSQELQKFGIKDIQLKLVIPPIAIKMNPWLKSLDMKNMSITVRIYFGSVQLASKCSVIPPVITRSATDKSGEKTHWLSLEKDTFVFDHVDLSDYAIEQELGEHPYAIVLLDHLDGPSDTKDKVPLGWAHIPLFQLASRAAVRMSRPSHAKQWTLLSGVSSYPLYPGKIPEILKLSSPAVNMSRTELLAYQSEVTATIFDSTDSSPEVQLSPHRPHSLPALPKVVPLKDAHNTPNKSKLPSEKSLEVTSPLPKCDSPWVKQRVMNNAALISSSEPFDLHLDGVRFIPDNASIIKVTSKFLQAGKAVSIPEITAMPTLDSSARCPSFDACQVVNEEKMMLDPTTVILITVYTIDILSDCLTVLGSCLLPVFVINQQRKVLLRVGGHQLRLKNGMINVDSSKKVVLAGLDNCPPIPAASVLVRLLPHTKGPSLAPLYSSGYYQSESCQPTLSESRILHSYEDHLQYPATVRDMVTRLQHLGVPQNQSNKELVQWVDKLLDITQLVKAKKVTENIDITKCVRYRIKMGLKLQICQVFGLESDLYVQCFARILPGRKVQEMKPTSEGYGKEEKFTTLKHDYSSFLKAPMWTDLPQDLHPFYDDNTCMLIQLIGLRVAYHPTADHSQPGNIQTSKGDELQLGEDVIIGWSVMNLFEGNSVMMGSHYIPVFRGRPTEAILQSLTEEPAIAVLKRQQWDPKRKFNYASLLVKIWDGHFELEDVPRMVIFEELLECVGSKSSYVKARNIKKGKILADLVLSSLDKKLQKQGRSGDVYKREREFFEVVMTKKFCNLIESSLPTAGYGPL